MIAEGQRPCLLVDVAHDSRAAGTKGIPTRRGSSPRLEDVVIVVSGQRLLRPLGIAQFERGPTHKPLWTIARLDDNACNIAMNQRKREF